jgi:DnaJ-class molecular chaperone
LYTKVDVALQDAVLGGEITVPTLTGNLALRIPPETQNGRRFRLTGQGMPELNEPGQRGDLYATINVILPTNLTSEQRDLFLQLRESLVDNGG